MSFLFVSHRTCDDDSVNELVARFQHHGIPTWVDHINGFGPGDDIDLAIQNALNDSKHALVVHSNSTLKSPEVRNEIRYLINEGKRVYVARIEEIHSGKFHWRLSTIAYVDLFKNPASFDTLVDAIKKYKSLNLEYDDVSIERRLSSTRAIDPRLLVDIVGREDDVAEVEEKLKGSFPVFITGIGGSGKSRLAYEVALGISGEGGAVWHECNDVSRKGDILELIKSHFALSADASDDNVIRLAVTRRLLVVIDNAESVQDSGRRDGFIELAHHLSQGGAKVLFTSREMWRDMPRTPDYTAADLPLTDSTAICLAMCKVEDVTLTVGQAQTLSEKARRHPRLIELAVTMCKTRDIERVVNSLDGLQGRRVEDALMEMFLRTLEIMEKSEATYGPMASATLYRLLLCRGGFTSDAARALAVDQFSDILPQSDDDLDEVLDLLQQWKFVRRNYERKRYSIAMLVSAAIGEDECAKETHAMYYANLSKILVDKLDFQQLVPESDNLRIAFERLLASGATEVAFKMYMNCSKYLCNRLRFKELQQWYDLLVPKVAEADDGFLKSYLTILTAELLRLVSYGDKVQSLKASILASEEALSYFPRNVLPEIHARILHDQGLAFLALAEREHPLENLTVAVDLFEHAVDSYDESDDSAPNYGVYNSLGLACYRLARLGRYDNVGKAASAFYEAFQLADKHGTAKDSAGILMNMGTMHLDLAKITRNYDQFDQALEAFEAAGRFFSSDEDPFEYAKMHINIGNTFLSISTYRDLPSVIDKFFEAYNEALHYYSIEIDPETRGQLLTTMGTTFLFWDNLVMAICRWKEAKDCFELVGDTSRVERLRTAIYQLTSALASVL